MWLLSVPWCWAAQQSASRAVARWLIGKTISRTYARDKVCQLGPRTMGHYPRGGTLWGQEGSCCSDFSWALVCKGQSPNLGRRVCNKKPMSGIVLKHRLGSVTLWSVTEYNPREGRGKFLSSAWRQLERLAAVTSWKCHSDQPSGIPWPCSMGERARVIATWLLAITITWHARQGYWSKGAKAPLLQPGGLNPGTHVAAHPLRLPLATAGGLRPGWSFPRFIWSDPDQTDGLLFKISWSCCLTTLPQAVWPEEIQVRYISALYSKSPASLLLAPLPPPPCSQYVHSALKVITLSIYSIQWRFYKTETWLLL